MEMTQQQTIHFYDRSATIMHFNYTHCLKTNLTFNEWDKK